MAKTPKWVPGTRVEYRPGPDAMVVHTFATPSQESLDRNVDKYKADPDAWDVSVRLPGENAQEV